MEVETGPREQQRGRVDEDRGRVRRGRAAEDGASGGGVLHRRGPPHARRKRGRGHGQGDPGEPLAHRRHRVTGPTIDSAALGLYSGLAVFPSKERHLRAFSVHRPWAIALVLSALGALAGCDKVDHDNIDKWLETENGADK